MDKFIARYSENGNKKTVIFDKILYNKKKAEKWLNNNGIKNFLFFFEPEPPKEIGENGILFKGEVGFDIDLDTLLPHIMSGKEIILDTYGGDSWEGLKIYDAIKGLNMNPSIGVLGTCASAGMQILLATENRWITPNSRGLIHNPWTCMCGDDDIFAKTAKELEEEKLNIANIYSRVSGKSLEEILSLMKEERILNAEEMQVLNFAKIKNWSNQEVNNNLEIKPLKNEKMTENETKQLNGIEKMINAIKDRLFPPKNLIVQDVNGVELDFGDAVETSEQIQVGSTATVAGEPANGEYVLNDGTVYVFEAGAITEIKEPEEEPTEDVDALKTEVDSLKAENAELKTKLESSNAKVVSLNTASDKIKNELTQELEKVQKEFKDFKKGFSKDKPELNVPGSDDVGGSKNKFTYSKPKNN